MRTMLILLTLALGFACGQVAECDCVPVDNWFEVSAQGIRVEYADVADEARARTLLPLAVGAGPVVTQFFNEPAMRAFRVRLYPSAGSLTDYWRTAWSQPGFERECWMIAAADSASVQMLAPRQWSSQSCGHNGNDSAEVHQVLLHEVVHVLHRRLNASPRFVDKAGGWFVEGVAVYASGQLSAGNIAAAQQAIRNGYAPVTLQSVLEGPLSYEGAGTLVRYIDQRYGRDRLRSLLRASTQGAILAELDETEAGLLAGWRQSLSPP